MNLNYPLKENLDLQESLAVLVVHFPHQAHRDPDGFEILIKVIKEMMKTTDISNKLDL